MRLKRLQNILKPDLSGYSFPRVFFFLLNVLTTFYLKRVFCSYFQKGLFVVYVETFANNLAVRNNRGLGIREISGELCEKLPQQ